MTEAPSKELGLKPLIWAAVAILLPLSLGFCAKHQGSSVPTAFSQDR